MSELERYKIGILSIDARNSQVHDMEDEEKHLINEKQ